MDEFKILELKFKEMQDALYEYLRAHKLPVTDKNITNMMNVLREVQTIVPGHQYIGIKTNELGYITGFEVFNRVVNLQPIPKDLIKGYYKLDKYGRFEIDEEKRERHWGEQ